LLEQRPKYVIRDTFLTPFKDGISIAFLLTTNRDTISTTSDERTKHLIPVFFTLINHLKIFIREEENQRTFDKNEKRILVLLFSSEFVKLRLSSSRIFFVPRSGIILTFA
jgi:hypothetical protein